MIFDILNELFDFYQQYAKLKGFNVLTRLVVKKGGEP